MQKVNPQQTGWIFHFIEQRWIGAVIIAVENSSFADCWLFLKVAANHQILRGKVNWI